MLKGGDRVISSFCSDLTFAIWVYNITYERKYLLQ